MRTDTKNDIPYELFTMRPKNEPEINVPQPDALQQKAFGAEADAQNGAYSQNTTARD